MDDEPPYGHDLKVTVKVTNKGSNAMTIGGRITIKSVYYTGVPYIDIKSEAYKDQVIPATESKYC